MSYRHDLFISYKWGGDLKEWVDHVFVPILTNVLKDLKNRAEEKDVFHDVKDVKPGVDVFDVIKDALAHSRCMIPVINRPYFSNSAWCLTELSAMLKREEVTGVRSRANHQGLIFPVLFVDETTDDIVAQNRVYAEPVAKEFLRKFLPLRLNEEKFYRISAGFKGTVTHDDLRIEIKKWVNNSIIHQIDNPPVWDEHWLEDQYFISRFPVPPGAQMTFTLPKL